MHSLAYMQSTTPRTAAELVAAAKQRIENLKPDQVAAEISSNDVTLVDLREPDERAQTGSIPGAIHAPRGMLEFYADPSSPSHRSELQPHRRTILHSTASRRCAVPTH